MTEMICGTCIYHRCIGQDRWVCVCESSDYDGYDTEYADSCDEWEERE